MAKYYPYQEVLGIAAILLNARIGKHGAPANIGPGDIQNAVSYAERLHAEVCARAEAHDIKVETQSDKPKRPLSQTDSGTGDAPNELTA